MQGGPYNKGWSLHKSQSKATVNLALEKGVDAMMGQLSWALSYNENAYNEEWETPQLFFNTIKHFILTVHFEKVNWKMSKKWCPSKKGREDSAMWEEEPYSFNNGMKKHPILRSSWSSLASGVSLTKLGFL